MSATSLQYPLQPTLKTYNNNVVYLDVNINYRYDQNPLLVTNNQAIIVKIVNVLFTDLGSRPFEPDFGSRIPKLVFRNIKPNGQQAYRIKAEIYNVLTKFMQQYIVVSFANITVTPDANAGAYYLSIGYTIVGSTVPQTLQLRYTQ